MRLPALLATLALCLNSTVVEAAPHAHHAKAAVPKSLAKNPAVKAYVAAADKMHKAMAITYTGDADIDFARGMVPHHQGAVDMIEVLLKHGKDPELRELAQFMSRWQKAEIHQMERWLAGRDNPRLAAVDNDITKSYQAIMHTMHKDMAIKYTGNADVDFVNGMIPHHQGAIDMAWVLVEHGRDPILRKLAGDVIRSQQQEIAWMRDWLKRNVK